MKEKKNSECNTGASGSKCLYLLDAMALAYRAHFIFISRPLINSKGQNTSAAYGFTTALLRLIEEHGMEDILVVFDAPGEKGTFRDAMYDQYKANRPPMPDDLSANLPYIKKIVQAMDIPVVEAPGVEADDVIGTLACRAQEEGARVVIVSPDKDFQQLLKPGISIYRPAHRGEEFDPITEDTFREKFGLDPEQFIDILALMGDSSDNVPGVPGIGEKTAVKLLQEYGSVENLLNHVDEVKGKKAREGLQQHRDDALLSKDLVTIRTNLELAVDWDACRRVRPNEEALTAIFQELEFQSLLRRIQEQENRRNNTGPAPSSDVDLLEANDPSLAFDFGPYEQVQSLNEERVEYRIIRSKAELTSLVEPLLAQPRLVIDTETTSVDQMWASLVGISFAWEKERAAYVPTPLPDGTPTSDILETLRPVFSGRMFVGHNLKYDLAVLSRHGVEVDGSLFDTMVAHYLLAPEEPHGLDAVVRKYLNYRMVPISDLLGSGKNQKSMRDVPIDQAGRYSCEDADLTLQLYERLDEELKQVNFLDVARRMEFPLTDVLKDMELAGIRVDTDILNDISKELGAAMDRIEEEVYLAAGDRFNIGSTQQLGEILFDKLGLPAVEKTSTGKPSTRENVLQDLATRHPLPGLILDWRQISKLKTTYVDSLSELIHPETGRVHTSFNQTITATGRLSSSNPNLQNIPVRSEMGREIRKAFVPAPGWKLLSADYVQIELRILAALSGDQTLRKAFEEGQDIHAATAALVYGVQLEAVTREQRRKAKEVNYGIPYGISAWGLARRLRSSVKEAQELIDQYQRSFHRVTSFLNTLIEQAREKGYAETLLGRRRYIPGILARNRTERSFAERVAVNMPIQGTQADMIKLAMVHIHDRLKKEGYKANMLLQVHDELVFEAPIEEVDTLRALVCDEMTGALPLDVPVLVDVGVADNWLDAH